MSRSSLILSDFSRFSDKRLGLLGGSFDPVHNGHIAIATTVLKQKQLDAAVFIPARQNPLKDFSAQATDSQRIEMLRLALRPFPSFFLSAIELNREEPSYSYLTANSIAEQAPGAMLYWIAGLDNLLDKDGKRTGLAHWYRKDDFSNLVTFVTCTRKTDPEVSESFSASAVIDALPRDCFTPKQRKMLRENFVELPPVDASSSAIRLACARGDYSNLPVPDDVRDYIRTNSLYRSEG